MSQVRRREEFDVTTCDVDTYLERLDSYFVANAIIGAAKVSTVISLAGPKTFKLLKSLISTDKTSDKLVDQLKQMLKTHVQPGDGIVDQQESEILLHET